MTDPDGETDVRSRNGHGDLPGGEQWVDAQNYEFHMGGRDAGEYMVTASSDLTAKVDFNDNGRFDEGEVDHWNAQCSTDFDIFE